jgi:hypothetical protein
MGILQNKFYEPICSSITKDQDIQVLVSVKKNFIKKIFEAMRDDLSE